jgi:hypothetical protein
MDHDDIAYDIVQDYLAEGPEYLAISEAVFDEGGDDEDTAKVAIIVRNTLTYYASKFNIQ